MIETPFITETTAYTTACIHLVILRAEMRHAFGPAIDALVATLSEQGLSPASPAFAHHFKITPDTFDFEVGFATTAPIMPAGRVNPGHAPAMKVARTVYHGPYEGLPAAWGEFDAWMQAHGLTQAEDLWEHYVTGPHTSPDPTTWRTELTQPLTS